MAPRLHPQIQATEGGAAVTRRRSPRLHPQTQENEDDAMGMMSNTSRWSWQGERKSNYERSPAFTPQRQPYGEILISTPIPYKYDVPPVPTGFGMGDDAVLAGNSLYWRLGGNFHGILEFDLVKQSLAVIEVSLDMCDHQRQGDCFKMMRADGGGLGLLLVSKSDCTAQLWKRKTDCDSVASWELARTIELDKLLSLKPEEKGGELFVRGIAEENNVLFLWTMIGLFMIHLKSLKFKNLFKSKAAVSFHPFESVYAAGIELWTFQQHIGEDVIVPAGCPFQVKNLQESARMGQEIRCLPNHHDAKLKMLQLVPNETALLMTA